MITRWQLRLIAGFVVVYSFATAVLAVYLGLHRRQQAEAESAAMSSPNEVGSTTLTSVDLQGGGARASGFGNQGIAPGKDITLDTSAARSSTTSPRDAGAATATVPEEVHTTFGYTGTAPSPMPSAAVTTPAPMPVQATAIYGGELVDQPPLPVRQNPGQVGDIPITQTFAPAQTPSQGSLTGAGQTQSAAQRDQTAAQAAAEAQRQSQALNPPGVVPTAGQGQVPTQPGATLPPTPGATTAPPQQQTPTHPGTPSPPPQQQSPTQPGTPPPPPQQQTPTQPGTPPPPQQQSPTQPGATPFPQQPSPAQPVPGSPAQPQPGSPTQPVPGSPTQPLR